MGVMYVREQGTTLVKREERILVIKQGKTLIDRPAFGVDHIALFGNIQVSIQAAIMMMEKGTDISYFTYSGRYIGHMAADTSKNIFLRMAQHEYHKDPALRTALAQEIVRNKIANQIQLLREYRWTEDYPWKKDAAAMQRLMENFQKAAPGPDG